MGATDLPKHVGELTSGGIRAVLDKAKSDDTFRADLALQLAQDPRGTLTQVFQLTDDETAVIEGTSDAVLSKYVHLVIAQLASPNYADLDVILVPGDGGCPVALEYHWVLYNPHPVPLVMKINLCEPPPRPPKNRFIEHLAAQL